MNYSFFDFLMLVGSLGLFLYGMKMMSEGLQRVAGDKMRSILSAITANRFKGLMTGLLITSIIQSSSATTVMVVSFVNAGLLTLVQSIGVIMGANIGTTVTAWLVSIFGFKFSISAITLPLIGISFPLVFSAKNKRKAWGEFLIGFALLFMGLDYLKNAVPNLQENPEILSFLQNYTTGGYGSILLFVFIGTVLTVIVQSSSATMAITLIMCSLGWIPFEIAAAMVLGENIGTTITANLAAIPANTTAKRAALSHTIFNLFGVCWMLIIFNPFINFIGYIANQIGIGTPIGMSVSDPHYQVATSYSLSMFHTLFNLCNTLLLIWFTNLIAKVVEKLIPTKIKDDEFRLKYISRGILSTSEVAVVQAKNEAIVFAERTQKMFGIVLEQYDQKNRSKAEALHNRVLKYEEISDRLEVEIAKFLSNAAENMQMSPSGNIAVNNLQRAVSEIESVADSCNNLSRNFMSKLEKDITLDPTLEARIDMMFSLVDKAIKQMVYIIKKNNYESKDVLESGNIEREINLLRTRLKNKNIEDIEAGIYSYQTGVIYMDIIAECEKMGDYIINVVEAFTGKENNI